MNNKKIKELGKIERYIRKIEKCIDELNLDENGFIYESLREINYIVMYNSRIIPVELLQCLLSLSTWLALEMLDGGKKGSILSVIFSIEIEINRLKEKKGL